MSTICSKSRATEIFNGWSGCFFNIVIPNEKWAKRNAKGKVFFALGVISGSIFDYLKYSTIASRMLVKVLTSISSSSSSSVTRNPCSSEQNDEIGTTQTPFAASR